MVGTCCWLLVAEQISSSRLYCIGQRTEVLVLRTGVLCTVTVKSFSEDVIRNSGVLKVVLQYSRLESELDSCRGVQRALHCTSVARTVVSRDVRSQFVLRNIRNRQKPNSARLKCQRSDAFVILCVHSYVCIYRHNEYVERFYPGEANVFCYISGESATSSVTGRKQTHECVSVATLPIT